MSTRQIHVFISHSWAYSKDYETLTSWIFERKWSVGQASLDLRNYSVPKDNPVHNAPNAEYLRQAIYLQIAHSHVVVIPAGMYAAYSKWIKKEIDGASHHKKPVIAVIPRGQQRASDLVVSSADRTVGWNSVSVIRAIWDLYFRGP